QGICTPTFSDTQTPPQFTFIGNTPTKSLSLSIKSTHPLSPRLEPTSSPMSVESLPKTVPNYPLIRERCCYQPPTLPKPSRRSSIYEWKLQAPFGTRFGHFCYRAISD